ncbi:alanine racemase [Candidatus Kuenenbacteria bacterium]|nr:alanine racemase [Candidatus Kuenenbacteria bacterium]
MRLLKFFRKIKKYFSHYSPSIEILISKTRLLKNLKEYQRQYPKLLFAPVLKSNAYSHGLVLIAQILDKENICFFVLDSLYEAIILRDESIKSEILIIGFTKSENIKNSKLPHIAFTITSLEQLQEITKIITSKIKIHLKVDTGMHRQGILLNQINDSIEIIKANKFINLEGVCSHFADADNTNDTFTKIQIKEWNKVVSLFKENFQTIKYFHISATAGTFYCEQTHGNVIRLGLGLYGINPSPLIKLNLQPVLQMQSIISSLKKLEIGERIGYNITHKTKEPSIIATIPAGYFEGVDRRLSNLGFFKINDTYCPIVGRVSMNITSIDVTSISNIKLGDKVIIISNNKDDKNSIENIAKLTQTIPYEILVHIPQHLHRITV